VSKERPIINHITIIIEGKWTIRTFLPLFDDLLIWAEDAKCPSACSLAYHCHPMVMDETEPLVYHKLCTLTVIRAGLVTKQEIIGNGR
jgi:hypothetical protein